MTNPSPIQIGLIGCGGIANGFHLKDLAQIDGVEVVYYADQVLESARKMAEKWSQHWKDYRITAEPEELLSSERVDAVIVATHHRTHAEFGASIDMGVYAVSGITTVLGPATSCSALVGTFEEGVQIDDNAIWLLQLESGAFAVAETSWTQVTHNEETVIYGTDGVITLGGPSRGLLRVYRRTGGVSWSSQGDWTSVELPPERLAAPHRHFVECIREGRQPLGTPEHARHVTQILLAAHESNRTGQSVTLSNE